MLDRALGKTFANLSTLVLVACIVTLPVALIHAFLFRDVLAVQEIAPEISTFPEGRLVRGVAKTDFVDERNWLLIALAAQTALLPLVYRAARRVIEVDDQGGVPTVTDAWTHLGTSQRARLLPGPILAGATLGTVCGYLVWTIGKVLAGMASADLTWALVGFSRGIAAALPYAFACGVAASLPPRSDPTPRAVEELDLY